ncbi:MAG: cytidine deaminase [Clostridium sp.]|nr:cytidine deaminase [Clostridium sp.]
MNETELIELACKGREQAYTPYSGFRVGAALLTRSGTVYLGCNIENASYGPTNCAERTAFFKAVSEGEREFEAIAIVGGPGEGRTGEMCAPCGVCRQVMMEFCDPKTFRIILENGGGKVRTFLLEELLPLGFGSDNLKEAVPADSRK